MDKASLEGQAGAPRLAGERSSRVARRRSNETGNGKWKKANDTHYCLEMFTLALHDDQPAQKWFQRRFSHSVLAWLKRHPSKEAVCVVYSEAHLLEKTFQYIWHSQSSYLYEFSTMTTIKRYLYASFNGVMLEALRTIQMAQTQVPPVGARQEPAHGSLAEAQKLWERIEQMLSNERERRLAYLLFSCTLKPIDIVRSFPQEFSDIHEIAGLRLTIIEQLCDVAGENNTKG